MSVRAKFQLQSETRHSWSGEGKTLNFAAAYDPSIPEDQKFAKATPSGTLQMHCDNPAALTQFTIGKFYYVDFTEVSQ